LTDGELVERFVAARDEAAFETLLWRHGPMVLSLCLRLLRDSHAAEDAFQATFLVLFCKAGSIGKRESVGSWLHRVAYRIALKARSRASLQRQNEAVRLGGSLALQELSAAEAHREMGGLLAQERDDLRSLLDKELNRLPEKYRAPLVLCYLEGKTQEQAARELSWPAGTVAGRVARGKELLRGRLERRGLLLSAPALVAGIAQSAQGCGVRQALVLSTIRAAHLFAAGRAVFAGALSANAATLAKGLLKTWAMTKLKIAGTVLAILLIGTAAATYQQVIAGQARNGQDDQTTPSKDLPRREAKVKRVSKSAGEAPSISCAGRVVEADDKDKAIAGATVMIYARTYPDRKTRLERKPRSIHATATTDAQGRFAFENVPLPIPPATDTRYFDWQLIVTAPGNGLAWKSFRSLAKPEPVVLTMGPEARLGGRLVDAAGKPASAVKVRVLWLEHFKPGNPPLLGNGQSLWLDDLNLLESRSDDQGRFLLTGLPKNLCLEMWIEHEHFQRESIWAVTTDKPLEKLAHQINEEDGVQKLKEHKVFAPNSTLTLQPGFGLRGQVIDSETNQPVSAVDVSLTGKQRFEAFTDREGRFSIDGLAPVDYQVKIDPGHDGSNLPLDTKLTIAADRQVTDQVFKLQRGTVVNGRVIDEDTRQGVAGVMIYYSRGYQGFPVGPSEADGSYRFPLPAGKYAVFVAGRPPGYVMPSGFGGEEGDQRFRREEVVIQPGQKTLALEPFVLSKGVTLRAHVVDADGKPVQACQVLYPWRDSGPDGKLFTDAAGSFQLTNLDPARNVELLLLHEKRRLGVRVSLTLPKDKKVFEADIQLGPTEKLTGRVLDENKKPIKGARITTQMFYPTHGKFSMSWSTGETSSDAEGRFAFTNMVPNGNYNLQITAPGYAPAPFNQFTFQAGQKSELPDVLLAKNDQSLSGTVVSPDGKPLPGISLSATPHLREPFGKPEGWTTFTDEKGRFSVKELPKGKIQIHVWDRKTIDRQTGQIGVQTSVEVEAGRQDVEIILPVKSKDAPAGPAAPEK
jgi:RNA polymerase sigma factor (sigma-70 family)